jgi:hypothetical protein
MWRISALFDRKTRTHNDPVSQHRPGQTTLELAGDRDREA